MTETALYMPFKTLGLVREFLTQRAARRKVLRLERALRKDARRLAALSPHLLADIGLADAVDGRR